MIHLADLKQYEEYIIAIRRDIHRYPETGFNEKRTSKLIIKELESFGFEVITNVGVTGVIGILKNGIGKTVALRADMDALNMQEETDCEFKSVHDGIMHSCGHDTHVAMLLGAAKYFSKNKDKVKGTIKFIFQSAEEGPMPGGGISVVKEGHIDDCDAVFGLHIVTRHKSGHVSIKKGPAMAAPDEFKITVKGIGTHASAPDTGVDSILVAADIVKSLQMITSRNIDPTDSAVVSVCTINGGTAFNILPEFVEMSGTIRTLTKETREFVFKRVKEIVDGVCKTHGATAVVDIIPAYPPVINDYELSGFVLDIARKLLPNENVVELKVPSMGGEDFSYYLEKKPGAYFWLGGLKPNSKEIFNNHNPKFDPDENAFLIGTMMHINIASEYLGK